jgi:hypothetical protein
VENKMKEEPKPIVRKVLESGLVDKATAAMLEQMGMLPSGASELVKEDRLKDATQGIVMHLAEELADAIEKEHVVRETALDLSRIRWPAYISISNPEGPSLSPIIDNLACVMDQMGRYYIRFTDANERWFVPGFVVRRPLHTNRISSEYITESQKLYIGDKPICFQVSTKSLGIEEQM